MAATDTATGAEPDSTAIPWRSPVLLSVLAATLMTPMDVPLISPALPEAQAAFGISESRAGLLITLYALPGILLGPAIGALADRLGRRLVLAGCLVLFGAAGTTIAFVGSFRLALGLRIVQGIAAGSVLSALAMTVVGDRYAGRQHDAVMGVTAAALSLGTAVYPLAGGYLATYGWNVPFLLYALPVLVAALVFVALDDPPAVQGSDNGNHAAGEGTDDAADEDGRPARSAGSGYVREAIRAVPTARLLALYGVMVVGFLFLFGGIYTAVPFYLAGAFGFSSATVGVVTSAMLVVTATVSIANGRLAASRSTTTLLVGGFGLYAAGLFGVALAGSVPLLVGALLVFGAGNGLVTPTLFAGLSALAPDHVRGGVMTLQTTTIGVSQAVGPALFVFLGSAVGYGTTLLGASAAATLFAAVVPVLPVDR